MIDLHCHILPGLDDGPRTIDESVEMCRIAYADGVRTIVATPHFCPGRFEHPHEQIKEKIGELQAALRAARIVLDVLPGADVAITPELDGHLEKYAYLTINGAGRYFLAEFPHTAVPPHWEAFLYTFLRRGIVPIITHPERNGWFLSRPDALVPFVNAGGLVQITAMSIQGVGGEESRRCAVHLLKSGLAHVIATDAHSATERKPLLSEAVAIAGQLLGQEQARRMVVDTPRAILAGSPIRADDRLIPAVKRRTWLQRIARK